MCVAIPHRFSQVQLTHFQITTYAILSPTLGKYVDDTIATSGVHEALFNIAGVRSLPSSKPTMVSDAHMTLGSLFRTFGHDFHRDPSTKGCALSQPEIAGQRGIGARHTGGR
jgi:hypothetical protein